ncbi:hypothetical protein [Parasitella parasitica]|uniref:Uncharacterized protein n=1 Tax=Parasitella parasitica TaxID=35722 RepID=A0A0B7NJZ4_9FUNG|nr:hypothetical protein [Parasitella parasitica]
MLEKPTAGASCAPPVRTSGGGLQLVIFFNYTQVNKYKKLFDSAKAVQAQSSTGFSGPTPIDISYETHVSSISISNIADGTSDMSASTSDVPQNDDIHALNTSGTAVNEGYYTTSSIASFSSNVAFKGNCFKIVSDFNTVINEKFTDIGYFITSDGRRALMSEIERLKLDFFKTTTTTSGCSPNVSIVPNNLDALTRKREITQRTTNHHTEDCNASADSKQRINAAESKFGGGKSKSRECFNSKKPYCVSPTLAQRLEVEVNSNNKGFMKKTSKKVNFINRIASTEEELTITYNSPQISAKFEIFDIFSDIDVVIGMDLNANKRNNF